MTTDLTERIADFHVRLGKLESRSTHVEKKADSIFEDLIEFGSALIALVCGYLGFGLPNHPYQYVFAILLVGTLYHKESFPRPRRWYDWILILINIMVFAIMLKLIIGGGDPKPFNWFALPTIEGGLTSFNISWKETSMSAWTLPLTTIQTFFLVLTLFGMLIGFELFCGLTTFVLVILALPALASFNWTFALPAMIASLFSFYLQSDKVQESSLLRH